MTIQIHGSLNCVLLKTLAYEIFPNTLMVHILLVNMLLEQVIFTLLVIELIDLWLILIHYRLMIHY